MTELEFVCKYVLQAQIPRHRDPMLRLVEEENNNSEIIADAKKAYKEIKGENT